MLGVHPGLFLKGNWLLKKVSSLLILGKENHCIFNFYDARWRNAFLKLLSFGGTEVSVKFAIFRKSDMFRVLSKYKVFSLVRILFSRGSHKSFFNFFLATFLTYPEGIPDSFQNYASEKTVLTKVCKFLWKSTYSLQKCLYIQGGIIKYLAGWFLLAFSDVSPESISDGNSNSPVPKCKSHNCHEVFFFKFWYFIVVFSAACLRRTFFNHYASFREVSKIVFDSFWRCDNFQNMVFCFSGNFQ